MSLLNPQLATSMKSSIPELLQLVILVYSHHHAGHYIYVPCSSDETALQAFLVHDYLHIKRNIHQHSENCRQTLKGYRTLINVLAMIYNHIYVKFIIQNPACCVQPSFLLHYEQPHNPSYDLFHWCRPSLWHSGSLIRTCMLTTYTLPYSMQNQNYYIQLCLHYIYYLLALEDS